MKLHTVKEIELANHLARTDLARLKQLQIVVTTVPIKFSEQEFMFLQALAHCEPPEFKDGTYIEKWKKCIKTKIDYIENLLNVNQKWLDSKYGKPHRCSLPKKKQRELGILPPV